MAASVRWRSMPPEGFVEVVDLDGLHAPGGVAGEDVVPDFLVDWHEGPVRARRQPSVVRAELSNVRRLRRERRRPVCAKGLLAELLVQPRQPVREELADLCGDVFEVFAVVEGMPPAVDEPPAVGDASGLGVRVDLEQSVFVCAAAPCSDLRMSSSTINRAAALTGVAVGHEGVVVVGAVGAVGVAFAVARIVCRAGQR